MPDSVDRDAQEREDAIREKFEEGQKDETKKDEFYDEVFMVE